MSRFRDPLGRAARVREAERASPLGIAAAMAALTLGAVLALLVQLAPLGPAPTALKPDLFWAVLAFFALRRPEAAPLGLVAALALLRDALVGGPLGAGALTLVIGAELLRARAARKPAPRSVWGDWAAAALVYAAAMAVQWLLMTITFAGPPPLGALVPNVLATAAAIPPMAGFLRYALRLGASPRPASREGRG